MVLLLLGMVMIRLDDAEERGALTLLGFKEISLLGVVELNRFELVSDELLNEGR
jgi:hypothetical protein